MDKIEKIRAEIERLKKLLEESTYYLDNSQQALGYSFALDDFNDFLDTLSEEPSENLEEAAETFNREDAARMWDYEDKTEGEIVEAAFKAGAEWMAGQGVSWEDIMTYYDGFLLYGKDERAFTMEEDFNEGDKVIVQIRKK